MPNKDTQSGQDAQPRAPGGRPGLVSVDDRIDEIAREALKIAKREEEAKRQGELAKRKRGKPPS